VLNEGRGGARHCAVWGSPIRHSLSPVLHRAAHAALGLGDWSYDRREVDEAGFADAFTGLDETWVGLSLTMPLKEVGLRAAGTVSDVAAATGAANTLVRDVDAATGWTAHNTDVHGITMALRLAGCADPSSVLVVGSGATARSAVAALTGPHSTIVFMVREGVRPETLAQVEAAGAGVHVVRMGDWSAAADVDAVISTVPPASVPGLDTLPAAAGRVRRPVVLDVVYGSGMTPLQRAARERGWSLAEGTDMLLHQAAEQVHLMTGQPAPLEAMSQALTGALQADQASGHDTSDDR